MRVSSFFVILTILGWVLIVSAQRGGVPPISVAPARPTGGVQVTPPIAVAPAKPKPAGSSTPSLETKHPALAGASQGVNSSMLSILTECYQILSQANHDYHGHRACAMREISAASKDLGEPLKGDGKGHENQEVSDAQIREVQVMLSQVRGGAAKSGGAAAASAAKPPAPIAPTPAPRGGRGGANVIITSPPPTAGGNKSGKNQSTNAASGDTGNTVIGDINRAIEELSLALESRTADELAAAGNAAKVYSSAANAKFVSELQPSLQVITTGRGAVAATARKDIESALMFMGHNMGTEQAVEPTQNLTAAQINQVVAVLQNVRGELPEENEAVEYLDHAIATLTGKAVTR